jgi:hypothetical protein
MTGCRLGRAKLVALLMLGSGCAVRADLGGSDFLDPAPASFDDAASDQSAPDAGPGDAAVDVTEAGPTDAEAGVDVAVSDGNIEASSTGDAPVDAQIVETGPLGCDDNVIDGNETDVDCGGSCPPCGLAQHCLTSADCGTWPGCDPGAGCACDAITSTCVYNHCSNHRQDVDETAVDCGGGDCPGCGLNMGCLLDSDCSRTLPGCDTNSGGCFCDWPSRVCVSSHCLDHKEDSSETGIDCGGGRCPGCSLGQNCQYDGDCASNACDGIDRTCVSAQCSDHHQDGNETDVDCGGNDCAGCALGNKCKTSSDCASGICTPGYPHVCF